MSQAHHPCLCCGYRTLEKPAGYTKQICPVCAWEDTPGDAYWDGSNEVDLLSAQKHFLAAGVCEDEYLDIVRSPLPEEARSEHWLSYDELRLRIIADIEREFGDVKREEGSTLHQMWCYDSYSCDPDEIREAALNDPEVNWQDLAPEKLSKFSESLYFLDDLGFRFYLPAFMRHVLAITDHPGINQDDLNGLISQLGGRVHASSMHHCVPILSTGQKQVVAAFVFLVSIAGEESQRASARSGLIRGWDAFVPDYLTAALL